MCKKYYALFYDVAKYANEKWNGGYTEREVFENAYNFAVDMEISKANGFLLSSIKNLMNKLLENATEESLEFLVAITKAFLD